MKKLIAGAVVLGGLSWTFARLRKLAENTLSIAKEVNALRGRLDGLEGKSNQYMAGGFSRTVPIRTEMDVVS